MIQSVNCTTKPLVTRWVDFFLINCDQSIRGVCRTNRDRDFCDFCNFMGDAWVLYQKIYTCKDCFFLICQPFWVEQIWPLNTFYLKLTAQIKLVLII